MNTPSEDPRERARQARATALVGQVLQGLAYVLIMLALVYGIVWVGVSIWKLIV